MDRIILTNSVFITSGSSSLDILYMKIAVVYMYNSDSLTVCVCQTDTMHSSATGPSNNTSFASLAKFSALSLFRDFKPLGAETSRTSPSSSLYLCRSISTTRCAELENPSKRVCSAYHKATAGLLVAWMNWCSLLLPLSTAYVALLVASRSLGHKPKCSGLPNLTSQMLHARKTDADDFGASCWEPQCGDLLRIRCIILSRNVPDQ